MSKKRIKVWLHSIRLDTMYAKKGHCCQDKFDKTLERAWNKLKSRKLLSVQLTNCTEPPSKSPPSQITEDCAMMSATLVGNL